MQIRIESLMGVYSIGHSTERCNGWMPCYPQNFTETFCAINFVCCALRIKNVLCYGDVLLYELELWVVHEVFRRL